MTQRQTRIQGFPWWRTVNLIGALILSVGLIGQMPIIGLLGCLFEAVGLTGRLAARRKRQT
jgi:hypothetical protein